jgi:hypothetical protein
MFRHSPEARHGYCPRNKRNHSRHWIDGVRDLYLPENEQLEMALILFAALAFVVVAVAVAYLWYLRKGPANR